MSSESLSDTSADADQLIQKCLDRENPRSFFLFAGAGSGKTRSLVEALNWLRMQQGGRFRLHNERVGVVTYTNAACDEIKRRLDFDPMVEVSTIHSFVWELIRGFDADIKGWLRENLESDLLELEGQQQKGKATSKAALDRAKSIDSKKRRLSNLMSVQRFTYNPNGENRGRDSLNHSEVVQIASHFLATKKLMQRLVVGRFPVLLVDESQDTNRNLMEALLEVQRNQSERFCLGLFGDTMQRIYADGKPDLGVNLPPDWMTPEKRINYRCPKRIVQLANRIRSEVDSHSQIARPDAPEGIARLFIAHSGTTDKSRIEAAAAQRMAAISGDTKWVPPDASVKTLTLEHKMAARRMGFFEMFEPLASESRLVFGLLDGSLPGVRFFSDLVLPLVEAKQSRNDFAVMAILRNTSPLLSEDELRSAEAGQLEKIRMARDAVNELLALFANETSPRFLDVLRSVARTKLFEIPEALKPIANRTDVEQVQAEKARAPDTSVEEDADAQLEAWDKFLGTPFKQICAYKNYVKAVADFDTHQGVKGLEFDRVLVVLDDEEAGGFLFSYEKLLGAKERSKTDIENERLGKETGIDRTRRLFYVTCSRAESALAVVAYSAFRRR
jgi:DNA helicase-2/ATP-dependent DNA helicase PcrA